MKTCRPLLFLLMAVLTVSPLLAQPAGRGPGRGFRGGHGRRHAHDERHAEDHKVFRTLLASHEKISRTVRELSNGVETVTESDDPRIAGLIKEHVKWMQVRVEETKPIRMRDPLFAELFRHTDKITMVRQDTPKGVKVTETSDDPYVAELIKAHAKAVSGFVDRGFDEAMKNHAVPSADRPVKQSHSRPRIKDYGKVVPLPDAAHQPRTGSRVVVDVTKGGYPEKLNTAIEKAARFVNIYHGAGSQPADVDITVVLHGEATLAVLNPDAYSKRFDTSGNPNLECLNQLHVAGVDICVCGQSLISKGESPDDVVVFAEVAVSALTSLVNLQADGYAYVPLK